VEQSLYYGDFKDYVSLDKNQYCIKQCVLCISLFIKMLHVFIFLIIPLLILPIAWWQIGLSYLVMMGIVGCCVSFIVSLAHVVENVEMINFSEDQENIIDNHWAVHEMRTTSNFATDNKLLSFLVGGLNFQIEHHLFPHLCHVHYPKIAPIVEQTAKEFGIPYHCYKTLFQAARSHFRFLKKMGIKDIAPEFTK